MFKVNKEMKPVGPEGPQVRFRKGEGRREWCRGEGEDETENTLIFSSVLPKAWFNFFLQFSDLSMS